MSDSKKNVIISYYYAKTAVVRLQRITEGFARENGSSQNQ